MDISMLFKAIWAAIQRLFQNKHVRRFLKEMLLEALRKIAQIASDIIRRRGGEGPAQA